MVDETLGVLVVSQIDEVASALTFYVVSTALMGLPATRSYEYERRRPEETPLYEILQTELNTFVSEREMENRALPDYVTKEL